MPQQESTSRLGPQTGDAIVRVRLPRDAKLTVNNAPTLVSGEHVQLPYHNLEVGLSYTYVFECQFFAQGKADTIRRHVVVRAGETIDLDLRTRSSEPNPRACEATLLLKVPLGAKLLISGQRVVVSSENPAFAITDLQPGKTYPYEITCEYETAESRRVARQDISVRAGDVLRVDFRSGERPEVATLK